MKKTPDQEGIDITIITTAITCCYAVMIDSLDQRIIKLSKAAIKNIDFYWLRHQGSSCDQLMNNYTKYNAFNGGAEELKFPIGHFPNIVPEAHALIFMNLLFQGISHGRCSADMRIVANFTLYWVEQGFLSPRYHTTADKIINAISRKNDDVTVIDEIAELFKVNYFDDIIIVEDPLFSRKLEGA